MGRDLGRLVQQRRDELGLSRRELAENAGLSYPYVSQIETGEREPALKTMHLLAQALDVPVEQLAGMTSPEQWLASPSRSSGSPSSPMSAPPEPAVDRWRDKVMPSLERRLRGVPPVERIALLNELLAQAVEDLVAEQADRSHGRT